MAFIWQYCQESPCRWRGTNAIVCYNNICQICIQLNIKWIEKYCEFSSEAEKEFGTNANSTQVIHTYKYLQ